MKTPAVPKMVPLKYHHEIKCSYEQFQRDIFCEILKNPNLDDKAFLEVVKYWPSMNDCPTGVLGFLQGKKGNEVSTRLYRLRKGKVNNVD